jgi:ligand-binding sensor domain-containing protein
LKISVTCILVLLIISCNFLSSQTPSFNYQKLGSEEGLNNANIFNVEQHRNGLIYFTTQNGIYFYDGYTFNKLNIDSLKSNALQNVFIKGDDELYLSIRNEGVAIYDFKKNKYDLNLKIKDNNADNLLVNDKYAFLLTSGIKLTIVELATGKLKQDTLKKSGNLAYCIYKTREKRILAGRSNGIYDVTNGIPVRLPFLADKPVHSITETPSGKLIIGSSGDIFIINNNKVENEIHPVYRNSNPTFLMGGERIVEKIIADKFGRIWFTTSPGENLYLYQNNTVYDIFNTLDISPSLINCIYKDRDENLWIGTNNDGAYLIQNSFFNAVNFTYANKNLSVNEVLLKENLLLAATSNGLYGLNIQSNQTRILSKPDEIFMEPINSIIMNDGVFYYTKRNSMNISPSIFYDGGNSYKFKPVIARRFFPFNGKSVIADWDGNILLCNSDASRVNDTLITLTDYRIAVNALFIRDSILFIGTNNGLLTYNFKTKKQAILDRPELNFNVNDISPVNGRLYAAHEAGITDIYARKLIQQCGNFALNSVKKIKYINGQVWLATLDGLIICDNDFNPIKIINKSNGLLSNSVSDVSVNGNSISIATARGVAVANFKNILKYSARMRPVTISHITYKSKVLLPVSNSFSLAENQEDISVYFHSPWFSKPNKQFFRYRLNDGEWKFFENVSQLNLTTLQGGMHTISISASVDNIVWSEPATFEIYKKPKLSEKQYVYLLLALGSVLVIAIIAFIWIRRVKIKAKRRLKEEQQVNLLKHQAMNSLLSPHFIFNSLTSIQNYINTNNSLRASEYLAKFSRLIRMIIEKASQSEITLHDELSRLTYYLELEKERFKQKFNYEIIIDEKVNTHKVMIPNMIIQPYVENCIIHGILPKNEPGNLKITFTGLEGNKFLISIEDDGIGLIKAAEHARAGHKSMGTSTIRGILEINSKLTGKKQVVNMTDKSTIDPNSNGTIITIELEL